jgi:hypothetical protein
LKESWKYPTKSIHANMPKVYATLFLAQKHVCETLEQQFQRLQSAAPTQGYPPPVVRNHNDPENQPLQRWQPAAPVQNPTALAKGGHDKPNANDHNGYGYPSGYPVQNHFHDYNGAAVNNYFCDPSQMYTLFNSQPTQSRHSRR